MRRGGVYPLTRTLTTRLGAFALLLQAPLRPLEGLPVACPALQQDVGRMDVIETIGVP